MDVSNWRKPNRNAAGKSPPVRAETPARTPRAQEETTGRASQGDRGSAKYPQTRSHRIAPGAQASAAVQRLDRQPAARLFPAQSGQAWRGAWASVAGQRAHRSAKRQAQADTQGLSGEAKWSSVGGEGGSLELEEVPDAKVPWLSDRPTAAAPADEGVSAGADRNARVRHSGGWWRHQPPLSCAARGARLRSWPPLLARPTARLRHTLAFLLLLPFCAASRVR